MSDTNTITVDDSAIKRIQFLRDHQGKEGLMLRITVEGGGCSGFQYRLSLDDTVNEDDSVFGESIVTDDVSLDFLKNSNVFFEESMLGAEFKIDNPNATQGCGCGSSFSV